MIISCLKGLNIKNIVPTTNYMGVCPRSHWTRDTQNGDFNRNKKGDLGVQNFETHLKKRQLDSQSWIRANDPFWGKKTYVAAPKQIQELEGNPEEPWRKPHRTFTMVAHISIMFGQWPCQEPIDWRYLPYIL